jgi:hypothetical protein
MEIYKGREIETEQLNDGKWIVCAQDNNGVMVVARPGWHYLTEEDGIEDVERLIDQSLEWKRPPSSKSPEYQQAHVRRK